MLDRFPHAKDLDPYGDPFGKWEEDLLAPFGSRAKLQDLFGPGVVEDLPPPKEEMEEFDF